MRRFNFLLILAVICCSAVRSTAAVPPLHPQTPEGEMAEERKQDQAKRDWFYTGLQINYVLLNSVDLATTLYSLDHGAEEANPLARYLVKNKVATVVVKGGATAAVLFMLSKVKSQDKRVAYVTLGVLNLVYGLVVRNNVGVALRL